DHVLQQLNYTYDAIGNITEIYDEAYETIFFRNQKVEPRNIYQYDALYRLIRASGRENYNGSGAPGQVESSPFEVHFPVDTHALRNYTQVYRYDSVGNILEMRHATDTLFVNGSWTRHYEYESYNNRLLHTWTGSDRGDMITYHYDEHGSMLNLSNTDPAYYFNWDYHDMIHSFNREGAGWAYYTYDSNKERSRKRLEENSEVKERLYLGGIELYRRY